MVAFLSVFAVYFFMRAWREEKYLGLVVTLIALFLTHYVGLVFIVLSFALILKHGEKAVLKLLLTFIVCAFTAGIAVTHKGDAGLKWIPDYTASNIVRMGNHLLFGFENADTSKPFFDRYFIGFFSIALVIAVIYLPKHLFLLYVGFCVGTVWQYKPIAYGYKDFASYIDSQNKTMVMTDATDYITLNYYSKRLKLQDGDWSGWTILKDEDIFDKSKATEDFLLVNRGPIEDWGCKWIFNNYCIYEWGV
jgi:hypothetical protein